MTGSPMRFSLFIALLVALAAVVFALQNPGYTELRLGPYGIHASTALILIASFGIGAMIGVLAMLPARFRKAKEAKRLRQTIEHLTDLSEEPSAGAEAKELAKDSNESRKEQSGDS